MNYLFLISLLFISCTTTHKIIHTPKSTSETTISPAKILINLSPIYNNISLIESVNNDLIKNLSDLGFKCNLYVDSLYNFNNIFMVKKSTQAEYVLNIRTDEVYLMNQRLIEILISVSIEENSENKVIWDNQILLKLDVKINKRENFKLFFNDLITNLKKDKILL